MKKSIDYREVVGVISSLLRYMSEAYLTFRPYHAEFGMYMCL